MLTDYHGRHEVELSDTTPQRANGVGATLDDLCRACKLIRRHTVMVAGPDGPPLRVMCDYCSSQHNYRGGRGSVTRSTSGGPQTRIDAAGPLPLVARESPAAVPISLIVRRTAPS